MRGGYYKGELNFEKAEQDFKQACEPANECSDLFSAKLELATCSFLYGDYFGMLDIINELLKNGAKMSLNPNWVNCYAKYLIAIIATEPKEKWIDTLKMILNKFPGNLDIVYIFCVWETSFVEFKDWALIINVRIEWIVECIGNGATGAVEPISASLFLFGYAV